MKTTTTAEQKRKNESRCHICNQWTPETGCNHYQPEKAQHTKGEWKAVIIDKVMADIQTDETIIARMIFHNKSLKPFSEAEANAQRIVKAVNMHDELVGALKRANDFLQDAVTGHKGYLDNEYKDTFASIEQLLKQAEQK